MRGTMTRSQGTPVLVQGGLATQLKTAPLEGETAFSEEFVQTLLFEHPECLPFREIEPGLESFRSVCREMPTKHGPIDNLFLTHRGDIAIAEAKLWRNPESRRKVVAQALDYASCIFEMSYTEFEQQALKGTLAARERPKSLYSLFSDHDGLIERDFVDAVSRNLERGRIIVLVVGDGIRSETERLTQALQSHAGFHFTFALVELAVFHMPGNGGLLVVPNTLALTRLIERGIVRIESGSRASILPAPVTSPPPSHSSGSISSEQFFELMAQRNPRLPEALKQFIAELESFGAYAEFLRSLNLKWDGTSRTYHLGLIQRDGAVWTD